jgi:hypothetical protein
MVHVISFPIAPSVLSPTNVPTDTQQISPNLPACTPDGNDLGCTYTGTGTVVPATAIVVKPRPTT